jgi:hypothetical protein
MSYTVTRVHTNKGSCWCQPQPPPTVHNTTPPYSFSYRAHFLNGHIAQVSSDEATYIDILPQDSAELARQS